MASAAKVKNELNTFFVDLKAEVVVAEILENSKISNQEITVRNRSCFARGYRRDIINAKTSIDHKLEINLSRNGIYDALPQGIFHSAIALNSRKTFSELRQKIKKEEADARMLFAPLENEFFLHRVFLEQQEKKLALQFNNRNNSFLLDFWDLKGKVANEYVFLLIKVLPLAYKISKNETLIAQCLGEILQEKVTIEKKFINLTNKQIDKKQDDVLGVNSTLTLSKTRILYPFYCITIELSDLADKEKYANDGIAAQLIRVFCDYFVPLEIDWETKITYASSKSNFELNSESAFLGLSTTI